MKHTNGNSVDLCDIEVYTYHAENLLHLCSGGIFGNSAEWAKGHVGEILGEWSTMTDMLFIAFDYAQKAREALEDITHGREPIDPRGLKMCAVTPAREPFPGNDR